MNGARGRPRKPGPRHPGGQLKAEPIKPNPRVVAMRRALLTGDPESTVAVDLTKADSALSLALARGWMTEERHRTAQSYASLFRTAIGALPNLRVARPLSDNVSAPSALRAPVDGGSRSGVLAPEDVRVAEVMNRPDATPREITAALKAHRLAKIDWSRMADADIARVFDAAVMSTGGGPPDDARAARANAMLRHLWSRLTPEQAREVFDICVLERWPEWVTLRAFGRPVPRAQERRRMVLEDGLDLVARELDSARRLRSAA